MFPSRALITIVPGCMLAASCAPAAGEPVTGHVVKVYDGDTITVESNGARHNCRLLGIDAPETSYGRLWTEMDRVSKYAPPEARRELHAAREVFRKWAKVMEAHAREARSALAGMVEGRRVRLAYDPKQTRIDRYGRLLVYVTVDGLDVNAEMLRRGLAVADTRFPCDRLRDFVKLWRAAQAARAGLWAQPGEPPQPDEKPRKTPAGEPVSQPAGGEKDGPAASRPLIFEGRTRSRAWLTHPPLWMKHPPFLAQCATARRPAVHREIR